MTSTKPTVSAKVPPSAKMTTAAIGTASLTDEEIDKLVPEVVDMLANEQLDTSTSEWFGDDGDATMAQEPPAPEQKYPPKSGKPPTAPFANRKPSSGPVAMDVEEPDESYHTGKDLSKLQNGSVKPTSAPAKKAEPAKKPAAAPAKGVQSLSLGGEATQVVLAKQPAANGLKNPEAVKQAEMKSAKAATGPKPPVPVKSEPAVKKVEPKAEAKKPEAKKAEPKKAEPKKADVAPVAKRASVATSAPAKAVDQKKKKQTFDDEESFEKKQENDKDAMESDHPEDPRKEVLLNNKYVAQQEKLGVPIDDADKEQVKAMDEAEADDDGDYKEEEVGETDGEGDEDDPEATDSDKDNDADDEEEDDDSSSKKKKSKKAKKEDDMDEVEEDPEDLADVVQKTEPVSSVRKSAQRALKQIQSAKVVVPAKKPPAAPKRAPVSAPAAAEDEEMTFDADETKSLSVQNVDSAEEAQPVAQPQKMDVSLDPNFDFDEQFTTMQGVLGVADTLGAAEEMFNFAAQDDLPAANGDAEEKDGGEAKGKGAKGKAKGKGKAKKAASEDEPAEHAPVGIMDPLCAGYQFQCDSKTWIIVKPGTIVVGPPIEKKVKDKKSWSKIEEKHIIRARKKVVSGGGMGDWGFFLFFQQNPDDPIDPVQLLTPSARIIFSNLTNPESSSQRMKWSTIIEANNEMIIDGQKVPIVPKRLFDEHGKNPPKKPGDADDAENEEPEGKKKSKGTAKDGDQEEEKEKKVLKKEAPKKEAPKKEAPKKEAPKKEAPKKEATAKKAKAKSNGDDDSDMKSENKSGKGTKRKADSPCAEEDSSAHQDKKQMLDDRSKPPLWATNLLTHARTLYPAILEQKFKNWFLEPVPNFLEIKQNNWMHIAYMPALQNMDMQDVLQEMGPKNAIHMMRLLHKKFNFLHKAAPPQAETFLDQWAMEE